MSFLVYFLNTFFYFTLDIGTDGLALATLITIVFFNTVKLWFVHHKFTITPFTAKSWKMILIIFVLFSAFYFWDFSSPEIEILEFSITPLINIALKSVLITVIYLYLILKWKISNEIDLLVKKYYK
jgi:hypothetical protein